VESQFGFFPRKLRATHAYEGLTPFGPRFLDEGLQLRARALVVDDFFPTLVAFCKVTQPIEHSATLSLA
jgi:hypothetical protein